MTDLTAVAWSVEERKRRRIGRKKKTISKKLCFFVFVLWINCF